MKLKIEIQVLETSPLKASVEELTAVKDLMLLAALEELEKLKINVEIKWEVNAAEIS